MTTAPSQCKWGGPNLSIIVEGNKIFKVGVSGVEVMDIETMKWQELSSDVPFALSKGMRIESLGGSLYVFGDGTYTYRWE